MKLGLRSWKLDVVSRERPFTRTATHRSQPRRAANLAVGETHLPCLRWRLRPSVFVIGHLTPPSARRGRRAPAL